MEVSVNIPWSVLNGSVTDVIWSLTGVKRVFERLDPEPLIWGNIEKSGFPTSISFSSVDDVIDDGMLGTFGVTLGVTLGVTVGVTLGVKLESLPVDSICSVTPNLRSRNCWICKNGDFLSWNGSLLNKILRLCWLIYTVYINILLSYNDSTFLSGHKLKTIEEAQNKDWHNKELDKDNYTKVHMNTLLVIIVANALEIK